ncbi:site-specific integrase [Bythopirellula polymerisocia]|uniref:Site-specific tyrosine recombinase XerC n=1 Tax=Bythopirellula polymerisocia TaxID=2528003 RepID=A0A5C6CSA8_9BACT|nr:site-specific integrase [Bythopirellula polymerisocia]TWU27392.1 site-specific tyrosine recombinase XerC [Bythopirellula polymerisocia]
MVAGLRQGRTEARETAPVLPVPDDIVEATLPHMPVVVGDMVRLQRLAGMRPNEVCILRPCDLDRNANVWVYRPESHKTEHHGRERLIFLGPKAQVVLLKYLARDSQAYCFRPAESEAKRRAQAHADRRTPPTCGNHPGSNRVAKPKRQAGARYSTDSYRRAIQRACDRAFPSAEGMKSEDLANWQSSHRWAPIQLRHSAATEIRKKFGLEAAQIVLGHSKADVTQIYAERDVTKGLQVAQLIG